MFFKQVPKEVDLVERYSCLCIVVTTFTLYTRVESGKPSPTGWTRLHIRARLLEYSILLYSSGRASFSH